MGLHANRPNRVPCIRLERGQQNELIVTEAFDPAVTCHDDWYQTDRRVLPLGSAAFRAAGQPSSTIFGRVSAQIDTWLIARLF